MDGGCSGALAEEGSVKARHVKATPIRMPKPATPVIQGIDRQTPISTWNSAMKPLNPGSPIEAIAARMKTDRGEGDCAGEMHGAEFVEIASVGAVVDHPPDDGEEQSGDHAVGEHLEDCAVEADLSSASSGPAARNPCGSRWSSR